MADLYEYMTVSVHLQGFDFQLQPHTKKGWRVISVLPDEHQREQMRNNGYVVVVLERPWLPEGWHRQTRA